MYTLKGHFIDQILVQQTALGHRHDEVVLFTAFSRRMDKHVSHHAIDPEKRHGSPAGFPDNRCLEPQRDVDMAGRRSDASLRIEPP